MFIRLRCDWNVLKWRFQIFITVDRRQELCEPIKALLVATSPRHLFDPSWRRYQNSTLAFSVTCKHPESVLYRFQVSFSCDEAGLWLVMTDDWFSREFSCPITLDKAPVWRCLLVTWPPSSPLDLHHQLTEVAVNPEWTGVGRLRVRLAVTHRIHQCAAHEYQAKQRCRGQQGAPSLPISQFIIYSCHLPITCGQGVGGWEWWGKGIQGLGVGGSLTIVGVRRWWSPSVKPPTVCLEQAEAAAWQSAHHHLMEWPVAGWGWEVFRGVLGKMGCESSAAPASRP